MHHRLKENQPNLVVTAAIGNSMSGRSSLTQDCTCKSRTPSYIPHYLGIPSVPLASRMLWIWGFRPEEARLVRAPFPQHLPPTPASHGTNRRPRWEEGPAPQLSSSDFSFRWQSATQGVHTCPEQCPAAPGRCCGQDVPRMPFPRPGPGIKARTGVSTLFPCLLTDSGFCQREPQSRALKLPVSIQSRIQQTPMKHLRGSRGCSGVWGMAVTRTRAAGAERGHILPGGLLHPWHSVLLFCHFFSSLYLHFITPYHV